MSTQAACSGAFRQQDPIPRESFPDASSVLDTTRLRSLAALEAMGCEGLVGEVVATFLNTVPKSLEVLREARLRNDAATLERVAHSLRGSCGLLGVRGMAEWAGNIERLAWPSGGEVDAEIAELLSEWPRVRATLEKLVLQDPTADGVH